MRDLEFNLFEVLDLEKALATGEFGDLDSDTAQPKLADARTLLATALADLQAMAAAMTGYLLSSQENARELYRLGLESVGFLLAIGDLLIGMVAAATGRDRAQRARQRGFRPRSIVLRRKGRRGGLFR